MNEQGRDYGSMKLDNGLEVFFFDQSRKLAGDRWYLRLLVEVPLEVKEEHFAGEEDPARAFSEFTAERGGTVPFRQVRERHFVDEDEYHEALKLMKEDFLDSNLKYLSKPGLEARYVRKVFEEWKEEKRIRELHREALQRMDA